MTPCNLGSLRQRQGQFRGAKLSVGFVRAKQTSMRPTASVRFGIFSLSQKPPFLNGPAALFKSASDSGRSSRIPPQRSLPPT